MKDLNLIIVNSLNFCRKQLFDKSSQVYLLQVHLYLKGSILPDGLPSSKLDFVYGYYLGFHGSSHLTKSGPIIASFYVVGSSLSNNDTSSSNLLFDYAFNQSCEVQQSFRSPGLQHFVDTRAMSVVSISRTASGAALLCSSCLGSKTSSNYIVLPLKLLRKLILEK